MAKAKAEAVKVYQFRKKIKGAFLADLEDYFRKNRTDFQPRWRYPVETAREREAQNRDFLNFGRRMLEVAKLQAIMANRDVEHDLEAWAQAARSAEKARDTLWHFLNSFRPAPPHPFEEAASPESFADVFKASWLKMLAEKSNSEGRATDLPALTSQADSSVQILIDALTELNGFAQVVDSRHRRMKAARKKTGHPQKVRFTVEMMRGWVFLFGRKPKYEDKNFAHFLSIAWSDICETASHDERWSYVIKLANKELEPELASLAQNGPQWI